MFMMFGVFGDTKPARDAFSGAADIYETMAEACQTMPPLGAFFRIQAIGCNAAKQMIETADPVYQSRISFTTEQHGRCTVIRPRAFQS
jgi:hypothetical protein